MLHKSASFGLPIYYEEAPDHRFDETHSPPFFFLKFALKIFQAISKLNKITDTNPVFYFPFLTGFD